MSNVSRRDFLKRGGQAAMAIAIADAALASSWAQSASATTRVVIDPAFSSAPLDRHIFGSFWNTLDARSMREFTIPALVWQIATASAPM